MSAKGYKIDFSTNELIMNYKFHKATQEYGSAECELVKKILCDFPHLTPVVKAGREVKVPNANKRLTYANMKKHIGAYENSEVLLDTFQTVKELSKTAKSPYAYVLEWFVAQFPNYEEVPSFENGKLYVLPVDPPAVKSLKVKVAKKSA